MMDELQEAIAIAEAGNSKEAQVRLARFLKRQPDSIEGWLALSRVVADRKRKKIFLQKILSIDPHHAVARSQLATLEQPNVTPDMPTVIEANRPDAPPAFTGEDAPAAPSPAATQVNVAAAPPLAADEDEAEDAWSPDADEAGEDGPAEEPTELPRFVPVTGAVETPPDVALLSEAPQDDDRTDWLLVGLGGLAILVGLILIFLLLQFF